MNQPKVVPPKNFRPAGSIEWVRYSMYPPPFIKQRKATGRRAVGIRYEAKAHEYMQELYDQTYVQSPWFIFKEHYVDKQRWCQPDALLLDIKTGKITIIEYKYQHTADAWWQLRMLYLPVIAKAFPPSHWSHRLCEVVKWYDPATVFPERVKLKALVDDTQPGEFGVHIWKP